MLMPYLDKLPFIYKNILLTYRKWSRYRSIPIAWHSSVRKWFQNRVQYGSRGTKMD